MKTWEKIILYPLGLYIWLTDGIKKMSKKWKSAMAMLMVVVMLCGMLPMMATAAGATRIKVAGTELIETGYYTVSSGSVGSKQDTEPAGGSGYVHWDAANHTLTLYGVTVDGGTTSSGIFANGDYTIKLAEGTNNTVCSGYTNAITCDAGSVTIEGPGTMNATGATNGIKAQYSVVIKANVTVTGNNGCGIVNSPTSFSNNADPVRIADTATVSVTGSTYGIGMEDTYGASPVIDSPNVTIKGGTAAFKAFPHGAPKLSNDIDVSAGENESSLGAYDSASYSTYKCVKTSYLPTYTVSFDANGGTGTMIPADVNVGEEYTLPECGFTAPSNKTFKAWSVGGEEKQPGDKITVTASTTVTAVWQNLVEHPAVTITITGLTAPQAGQSAEEWLDGISPVLSPDYEWADAVWYEGAFDNYGEMMTYTDGDPFLWNFAPGQSYTLDLAVLSETPTLPVNATVNVPGATSAVYVYWGEGFEGWYYADFLIVYTVGYEVSFDANGGTGTMIPAEVKEGEEYTLPECGFTAPSNKAFKAWSVGGEEKQPGDKITVSANTTVTAVWQNLVKYNLWVGGVQVTNTNAGNITGEGITGAVSYDSTTKTLTLNNATITGAHEFSIFDDVSGIYGKETLKINLIGNNTITGSDNGGSSYGIYIDDGNLTFTGTGSLTVSAADLSENNWSVAVFAEGTITVEESCTITAYCGTNAWIASAFKSYAGSNEYNLPNATGILVAGNKNAPEATNFEVCNGDPDEFQYLRIAPGYTVTLNKNGGTINSGNVTCYFVDTGATLPTEVTKANSIFGGWYDNAECTGTAITEIPVGSTGEKEYWAKWTAVHTCSIQPVEKVWPSCENGGKEAYYKCEGCGKFFEDANGTTEIADIDRWGNLDRLGHTEGTEWKTDGEYHWHICTVADCGAVIESSKAFHSSTGANVATCTKLAVCDVCGVTYGDLVAHGYTAEIKNQDTLKSAGNCRDAAVYWYSCSTCGKVENDDNHTFTGDKVADIHVGGTTLVNQAAANHKTQTDGYTGDTKCLGCNEIISYGQVIPAGAHTAENVWTTDGAYHWKVCSAENCGVVMESTKAFHSSTGANVATCTKLAVCDVCGVTYGDLVAHGYTAEIKNQQTLKSAGNCRDAAVYWYSCSVCGKVENDDNHTFTGDTVADIHVGGTTLVNQAAANHKTQTDGYTGDTKCLGCNEIIGYGQVIPAGAHTAENVWTTDGAYHWKVCSAENCGVVMESTKAFHSSTGANVATCTKLAVCDVCGVTYGDLVAHGYTAEIKNQQTLKSAGNCRDAAVYWYSCSVCGKVENDDNHTFTGDTVADIHVGGTTLVNQAAANHKTQTDGYTGDTKCLGCNEIIGYGQVIPAGAHIPADVWSNDGDYHWKECTVVDCGAVIDSTKEAHTPDHDGGATEEYAVKCAECLYEIEAQLIHTHVFNKQVADEQYKVSGATCTEPAKYYVSCACGEKGADTFENGAANGHTEGTEWKSDADNHWHICTVADCGAVIESSKAAHTSTGDNVATCQKKAVCDVCGVTYGDFADHDWNTSWEKDETGHWYKCNTAECAEKKDFAAHTPDHQGGATEEYAVKCAECLYEIEAQLIHTHVFNKQVADEQYKISGATCTEPAKYYVSCACGEKGADTFENGAANGHTAGTEWKSDADNHWHICTVAGCGAAVDSSAHTPDRAAATETDPVKCSVCGYEIAPALGHTHAYGAAWKSDADNHWNECVCGEKANAAAHKDENADGKCDVCEYEVGTPGGSDDDDQPAGNPQTSDNNMLWIWLGLLCVSAMGIFAVIVFSKKKSVR